MNSPEMTLTPASLIWDRPGPFGRTGPLGQSLFLYRTPTGHVLVSMLVSASHIGVNDLPVFAPETMVMVCDADGAVADGTDGVETRALDPVGALAEAGYAVVESLEAAP